MKFNVGHQIVDKKKKWKNLYYGWKKFIWRKEKKSSSNTVIQWLNRCLQPVSEYKVGTLSVTEQTRRAG